MAYFADSVTRDWNTKFGEIPSLLDFGAIGDGTHDDTVALQAALDSVVAADKLRTVRAPAGLYKLTAAIEVSSGVTLVGDGPGTVFKLADDLADGYGIFDLDGVSDVSFADFVIDGDTTTPAGLTYSSFSSDPIANVLTKNTSIWIKSGAKNIRLSGVQVTHTGGYAVLIDAASSSIQDVILHGCSFVHNRPHLFGTDEGAEDYGSWTGGVFYRGAGTARVRNMTVSQCIFRKCTGNCLWGHSPELTSHHENFSFVGNVFQDIGLDGILIGDVYGGVVSGNSFHRVGYIHESDGETASPRMLLAAPATALDSSGYVRGVSYIGNSFVSINGGAIDLDGFRDGVVSGNSIVIPQPGDDQYTTDVVDNFGPSQDYYSLYSRGINLGDTQSNGGASNITIRGNTISGCMASAISAAFARNCIIEGNRIVHPADSHEAPIQLYGASDVDADWVCHNNIVRGNSIDYTGASACIVETGTGWASTHVNRVFDNQIAGANQGEFKRTADSGSVTGFRIATNDDTADQQSESEFTREGFGTAAALKLYTRINGTRAQVAQLGDANGLLLIGDGTAGSGAVATATRNSLAWGDAVATGKLYADSMLVLTDASYAAADGDVLDEDYGLLRYDKTTGAFLVSTSTQEEGDPPVTTRVWADLLTGGSGVSSISPGTLTGAVTLAGTANRISLSQDSQTITFTTPQDLHTQASVAFAQLNLTYLQDLEEPEGVETYDGVLKCFDGIRIYNTASVSPYVDFANYAMRIDARYGSLHVRGTTGMASILVDAGWVQAAGGFTTASTATDSIQSVSGGVTARYLIGTRSLSMVGDTEANAGLSNAGQGRIFFDSELNKWRASQNGGAYVDLVGGGGGTPGGSSGNVQYNDSGVLNGMDAFNWDETNQRLELKGKLNQTVFVIRGAPVAEGSTAHLQQWFKNLADVAAAAVIDANCVFYGPALALRVDDISPASSVDGKYGAREIRLRQTSGDAANAGTIAYRTLGDNAALDIIGAGTTVGGRQVRIYDGLTIGNAFSDGFAIKAPLGSIEARVYVANGGQSGDITPAAGVGAIYFNATTGKWRVTEGTSGPQDLLGAATVPNDISCYTISFANMDRADRDGVMKLFDSLRIHNTASVSPYTTADNYAIKISGRTGGAIFQGNLEIGNATNDPNGNRLTLRNTNAANYLIYSDYFAVAGNGDLTAVGVLNSSGASGGLNIQAQTAWNSIQTVGGIRMTKRPYIGFGVNFNPASPGQYGRNYAQYGGTNSGMIQLHADGDEAVVVMDAYSDVGQPAFIARRAKGSSASPGAVVANDALLVFGGRGWHTSGDFASGNRAAIIFRASETWTYSAQGAHIEFGTTPIGSTTRVARMTCHQDGMVEITGNAGMALKVTSGYAWTSMGYYSDSAQYNGISSKNGDGGVLCRSLHAVYYSQVGASNGAPSATTGAALTAGAVYWDTSAAKLRVYNGTTWADVSGGSTGVSSLNSLTGALTISGTANQVAVYSAGTSISLSLPQNIHTAATPTFSSLALSLGSGAAIYAYGGGWIDCAGGFYTASASQEAVKLTYGGVCCREINIYTSAGGGGYQTVINTSKQFVGNGVSCPLHGVGGASLAVWNSGSWQYSYGRVGEWTIDYAKPGGGSGTITFFGGLYISHT